MSRNRTINRAAALPLAGAALALSAGPVAAHVTISPAEGAAGSNTVLTASVPHGCEGSPTTRVAIQMPGQIFTVTPTRNPLWEVRKVVQQLDEPVADAHGNEITERVAQVVYTAKEPLPEGYRDAFELSLQLPDTPGETLAFPVIQSCVKGKTAWVETAEDGNTDELEAPAPTLTVLPAEDTGAEDTAGAAEISQDSVDAAATGPAAEASAEDSDALSVAALVAGLLGLAAGAAAFVVARRRA